MNIICGTDLSPAAESAATVAAALARRVGGPLVLTHVLETAGIGTIPSAFIAELRGSMHRQLSEQAARLRGDGLVVEEELPSGIAEQALSEVAARRDAWAIVLGAVGRHAIADRLLGSTAERVAASAPRPTLLVRESAPLLAWLRGEEPLRVFLAFDFTDTAEAALRWTADLEKLGPCQITAAYVVRPADQCALLGSPPPSSPEENPPEVQAALDARLGARLRELIGDRGIEAVVAPARRHPELRLCEIAAKGRAGLLVTGTHRRHGWARLWHGSISRGLLHSAATNVACVPLAGSGE